VRHSDPAPSVVFSRQLSLRALQMGKGVMRDNHPLFGRGRVAWDVFDGAGLFALGRQLRKGILNHHPSWYGAYTFATPVHSEYGNGRSASNSSKFSNRKPFNEAV
jgi:hypothetical protein